MNTYKPGADRLKHETSTNPETPRIRNGSETGLGCCHFRISDLGFRAFLVAALFALPTLGADLITTTVDSGGGRSSAGNVVNDGCLGGIGGVSQAGSQVVRHGFAGQLADAVGLAVNSVPASVNEGATSQLAGLAAMDDDSVTPLAGSDIAWASPSWPIQQISSSGVATADVVYEDTVGNFSGQYQGVTGNGSLLVRDTNPDNYGIYAGDELPDWWQVAYFGVNNPAAGPLLDPDEDGQNNRFEYIAKLVPTNAASAFRLRIEPVPGQPSWKNLVFSPRWEDRVYTPVFGTNLLTPTWQVLTTTNVTDEGVERTVTDTAALETNKFYRIQIRLP